MIDEGADAPAVSLPAYADGERRRVDLGEYVGDRIVVLAFYPADFGPGCRAGGSDLGDLDIFTMQKDVAVFGVSPDSTYSHEAFAERYDLRMALLSDPDGEAAEAYGVSLERDGERLCRRAVFVIDHHGVVRYAWSADDPESLPDVGPIKDTVGSIGGDDTAVEQYRSGHTAYAEGREAFVEAMTAYEDGEWMDAQNGFETAESAFAVAADHLDTAARFAETDDFGAVVDRSQEKADTLGQAAGWLAESANAFARGSGASGEEYRRDAQPLVDAADDLPEPADPADLALTDAGVEMAESVIVDPDEVDDNYAWQTAEETPDASLDVAEAELDAAAAAETLEVESADATSEGDAVEGDLAVDFDAVEESDDDESAGDADDAEPSPVENDAVEGDLDVDLDAVEPPDPGREGDAERGAGGDDEGARDGTEMIDADPVDASAAADEHGGERNPGDDRAAGETSTGGTGLAQSTGPADGGSAPEDDESDHGESVELDLADPTDGAEADGEDADDPRADWNVPGR